MRKTIFIYFLPLLFSFVFLFFLAKKNVLTNFFNPPNTVKIDSSFRNLMDFENNPFYEDQFLLNKKTIFILGSSELSELNTESSPYNFITDHFKTKLIGIGHCGNQCFSIYSQLLANERRLKNAPIVIVLSPGWFYTRRRIPAYNFVDGTSASVFLEFNSERFLANIINNDSISLELKSYEYQRIAYLYRDISPPNLAINWILDYHSLSTFPLNYKYQTSKYFMRYCIYPPMVMSDKSLLHLKTGYVNNTSSANNAALINRKPILSENIIINWDSLYFNSRKEVFDSITNNKWGIDNNYYTKYIKGNTIQIDFVEEDHNQELKDFRMLLKLVKEKKANASFIILPLNPFFFNNCNEITPLIKTLETEIEQANFKCLNFWEPDSTKYEKGILWDISHLSKYGWYKADKFIVDTYHLTK